MKRYVIRRRAVLRATGDQPQKEVWCTWVLECDDSITTDVVEAILEETHDFEGDMYKDGDSRYTSKEIERARNWNEVIECVPLIKMQRASNGYDLTYEGEAEQEPQT